MVLFDTTSNGGGGHFNGLYRSFLVSDANSDSQILSFSMFGTARSVEYDNKNTNRSSYTIFFMAIDKFKISKSILEYNVDKYIRMDENKVLFKHDGRISSFPSVELRKYIRCHSELIKVENDVLDFGWLPSDKLLYLDGELESRFIYSFLEYALLREAFRKK